MAKPDDMVLMAVIGAPHGVRGELRANPHTDDPLALSDYSPLCDETGRVFKVLSVRPAKNVVVIRLEGINGREAAEALKGTSLYVPRDRLPDDLLEEEEYFHADLEGLTVRDPDGNEHGTVSGVYNFGAGDILELSRHGKKPVMIPFSEAAVPHIDWESGVLTVDPAAAGLDGSEEEQGPGSRRRRPSRANKKARPAGEERS
ncbi:ribosome maturation factor RimM [Hoeflea sp. TYP-13]|uniref:ribosome maturation factor RimM n=1 Tax=Hoeflea sp. TYP-13 TaxID=3230023 RepID=UPI0034C6CF7F